MIDSVLKIITFLNYGILKTKNFIFIAFLGHFLGLWGFHQAINFSKIFQIFENFCLMKPHTAKIVQIMPNVAFFGQKSRFFSKPLIFLNFGALGAEMEFFRPPSVAEVWNSPPPLEAGPPKYLLFQNYSSHICIY